MKRFVNAGVVAICAGCASPAPPDNVVPAGSDEIRMMVRNYQGQQARIYASGEGRRTLIGSVPARGGDEHIAFEWPAQDSLSFVVAFADGRRCRTEAKAVRPEVPLVLWIYDQEWNRRREGSDGVWRECDFDEVDRR
jgi:hypothetical protein